MRFAKGILQLLRYLRSALALLWLPLCSAAADSLPGDHEALMLALRINRQAITEAMPVLRSPDGGWLLPVDALRSANIRVPEASALRFNDTEYLRLNAFGVNRVEFDSARQMLEIEFRPEQFGPTSLLARPMPDHGTPSAGAGAFVNYQFTLDRTPIGTGVSLFAEGGVAVGSGVALSSHGFIDRPSLGSEAIRLESSYTRDDPGQMARLRVGDSISRPATGLGRPVRFAGLQWGTNFLSRPGMITMPVATLSGQAALPSTVDLYVDNVLQARRPVPPGPFSITSAPLVTGEGEVLLKITDLAGQEQIISQRIVTSTALLAPGLTDYSVEIGALRQNIGLSNDGYGDGFVSGGWRHGFSDRLTVEAGASIQQGGRTEMLNGIVMAVPRLGIVNAASGFSRSEQGNGMQLALGFERRTPDYNFTWRSQRASDDYQPLGFDAGQTLRRLDSVFYGHRIGALGRLGLSFTRQQRQDADPVSISTVSFSTRQTDWGSLILSLAQTRTATTEHSLSLFWVKSLGRDTSISASHLQRSNGPAQDAIHLQQNMAPGEGWGYRLQAAREAPLQASVFGQNSLGSARLDVAELDGETSVRAGIGGGIAWLDGQWFMSRRVETSFGLVSVQGFPNVRVYVDNQLAGRTNAQGFALLPRLHPYIRNNVSVEPLDLPLDAQIDAVKMQPVPAWRSGVRVDFPIRRIPSATLDLVQEDGSPVPLGASVMLGSGDSFVVGHEGLLYLTGVGSDDVLNASWPGGNCMAAITVRPEPGSVPHLGRVNCLKSKAQP